MNKAIGVIPARWASTRFPGKPLHLIAGKPLLQRVWERCCRAKALARVIIATDDVRIVNAALDWGAHVTLTLLEHQCGTDRVDSGVVDTPKDAEKVAASLQKRRGRR